MRTRRILTAAGIAAALLLGPATMANAYEGGGYTVKVSVKSTAAGNKIVVTVKVPDGVKKVKIRITCPNIPSSEIIIGGVQEKTFDVVNGQVACPFTALGAGNCYIEVFDAETGKQIGGRIPVTFTAAGTTGGTTTGGGTTVGTGGLAQTGAAGVAPFAIGSGVLVAGGATAVAVGRKRRRAIV